MQLYELISGIFAFGIFVIYRYNSTQNTKYTDVEEILGEYPVKGMASSSLFANLKKTEQTVEEVVKTDDATFVKTVDVRGNSHEYIIFDTEK